MSSLKIGLSLSFCVAEILRNRISLDEVSHIISSTRASSSLAWEMVIDAYLEHCWQEFTKDQVKPIIEQLTIIQPRLENDNHYPCTALGCWVTSEEEILWSDDPDLFYKLSERLPKRAAS